MFRSNAAIINDIAEQVDELGELVVERNAEMKRLRDALREIAEHDYLDGDECRRIAMEALA